MSIYTLPELPYDYSALEPHISGKIMELHHDKHHAAYVTGANAALENLAAAREAGDLSKVNQFSKDLAFNLGGHTNHSIFWKNLSLKVAANQRANSLKQSRMHSVRSMHSRSTSPQQQLASRVLAGQCSHSIPFPASSTCSSFSISRATFQ